MVNDLLLYYAIPSSENPNALHTRFICPELTWPSDHHQLAQGHNGDGHSLSPHTVGVMVEEL